MAFHQDTVKKAGLILGPLTFSVIMFITLPGGLSPEGTAILASTFWIAIWRITEAIPIAVTALLPIVLFPVTGGMGITETTVSYGHPYIFLFIGGFIISKAIEKWKLHKRIALTIMGFLGTKIKMVILGFMLSTAFLSMWISNTATAVMMLPIGMAIITLQEERPGADRSFVSDFGKALMLAIAYSASIGGIATLIGTPPNLVLAAVFRETYHIDVTFIQWFKIGLPISAILLFCAWKYLTAFAFHFKSEKIPGGSGEIKKFLKELGPMSREEKTVLLLFVITALLWIFRPVVQLLIPAVDDSIIAIFSGITFFMLPGSRRGRRSSPGRKQSGCPGGSYYCSVAGWLWLRDLNPPVWHCG